MTLFPLVGDSLDGARLDAQLAFPGQIKQVLTDWRTGFPPLRIDDRPVDVIEGRTARRARVKLYFDRETGFLVRSVRYSVTAVGTVPITVVYSNYRDVPGLGVKIPYTWRLPGPMGGARTTSLPCSRTSRLTQRGSADPRRRQRA